MNKSEIVKFLRTKPYLLAKKIGFKDLTEIHNKWIIGMVFGKNNETTQASRGTYKTSCVSFALALIIVILPNKRTMFLRKTDNDVKEVIKQVQKILSTEIINALAFLLYGKRIKLTKESATEINTNLTNDIKGTSQLVGLGIGASLTGKHFDFIFTDDIVNVKDRISKAERDRTKLIYQELSNILNKGGKIYNTGTPWHKDDCFSIMPEAEKYDCYHEEIRLIISPEQLEEKKNSMSRSLFAANYELRHIASEDVMFDNPQTGADQMYVEQAKYCHIDAAYGGEDWTAMTIARKYDGKLYVFGKIWHKHVDDCIDIIISWKERFMAGKFLAEKNADKGYLVKELRNRGQRAISYNETMNKFLKISSYLKGAWNDVVFVQGTDEDYLQMILDYNENAEHDDAPDSLASIIRKLYTKENA